MVDIGSIGSDIAGNVIDVAQFIKSFIIGIVLAVIAVQGIKLARKSREGRMRRLDNYVYQGNENSLGCEILPSGDIDTLPVVKRCPDIIMNLIHHVIAGNLYLLEEYATPELLENMQESNREQERYSDVHAMNVEVIATEYIPPKDFTMSGFLMCEVEFDCNVTLHSKGLNFVIDNFNTPKRHKINLSFLRSGSAFFLSSYIIKE